MNDQRIIDAFVVNKRDGIRALFERYYRPLVIYASNLIRDETMAEDIVQEFFVRLWEDNYLESVGGRALSSYLFSSVRNSCYTYGHKRDVLRERVDYTAIDIEERVAETMSQEIVDRVMEVLRQMPEQTGRVLDCVLMRDMKYQEAADELQVSVNTVKTLLRNGMRMLRESMQGDTDLIMLFVVWHQVIKFKI